MSNNKASSLKSAYGTVKSSKSNTKARRPSLSSRNSSYFRNSSILRRKTPSPTSDTFSQVDAQWFLRLPEKVQRRHFTQEERILLSGHTGTAVPDAADEKFYKFYTLSHEANRSVPTLRTSSYSSLSSLSTFDLDIPAYPAVDADEEQYRGQEENDSVVDMDESMIWFDDTQDLDLASTLDDYHLFVNQTAEPKVKARKCGPSFRRALSLTSLPKPSFTSTPPPLPPMPPRHTAHQRRQSRVQPPSHAPRASISTIEPSAQHYQDPEARLKLRVYLASPQKFDEAIEFGFPSMDDKDSMPLSRPSLSRSHATAPCKTFLDTDNPSVFDALDDDEDSDCGDDAVSLPERETPYTPVDTSFHEARLLSPSTVAASSTSSNAHRYPKPVIRHDKDSEHFAQLLAGGREMTLRMTLTRPDLRADEQALYAKTTGDDPLALEHLPPTKSEADIWDTMPKDQGIVKKFWRKFSGKGGSR